jgi:KDO2-lipid IV(A) lauroyltransferase
MTLAVRLVQQTDANCFVLRSERLAHGRGYRVHVTALDSALLAGSDLAAQTAAAIVMNTTMEKVILQDPGQYLWGYNRYKQPREQESVPAAAPADPAQGTE